MDTREFNFTSYLKRSKVNFVGRRWLYGDIMQQFNTRHHRLVLVTGDPRAGKSALTAQLICSRSWNSLIHSHVLGYHVCKYSDKRTQDAGKFVRNLADMIARRIPEYGYILANSSLMQRVLQKDCLDDPEGCFELSVLLPLSELTTEAAEHYYIVVDVLDECQKHSAVSGQPAATILGLILNKLPYIPPWARFIVTSRNESDIFKAVTRRGAPNIAISPSDPRNLEDISVYIADTLYKDASFYEKLQYIIGYSTRDHVSYLTSLLLQQGQGNFLFVKEMLNYWKLESVSSVDVKNIPKALGGIYEGFFRRIYATADQFKPARHILEVLVASFEPMTAEVLFDFLQLKDTLDFEYDFLLTLNQLSHFIRRGENETITLFHLSLIEWLTGNQNKGSQFYVNKRHGHRHLTKYLFRKIKEQTNQQSLKYIFSLAQHNVFGGLEHSYWKMFSELSPFLINSTVNGRTTLHMAASVNNSNVLKLLSTSFTSFNCPEKGGFNRFNSCDARICNERGLLTQQGH